MFSYRVRLLSLVRARKALRCLVLVLILYVLVVYGPDYFYIGATTG